MNLNLPGPEFLSAGDKWNDEYLYGYVVQNGAGSNSFTN